LTACARGNGRPPTSGNILLRISKSDDAQHGVIPIQTLAREGFIREQGNLVRELRKLLKRGVKLALAELLHSAGNMGRLFKQACGIGADVNALGRRLSAQFRLNLGLDLNNDRHRRRLSRPASGSLPQAAPHSHART